MKNSQALERKADFLLSKGKKKKKVVRRPQYDKYIKSVAWKNRKYSFYKKYGRKCYACGSTRNISIHHISYRRLGREKDEDLIVFCWDCHNGFHEIYGVKDECMGEVLEFIESKQWDLLE